jgi:hypothetical protein
VSERRSFLPNASRGIFYATVPSKSSSQSLLVLGGDGRLHCEMPEGLLYLLLQVQVVWVL